MMGETHMLGGVAAWAGICALAQPTPGVVVAGAGLAVAGGLAPDIDHRRADAAQIARGAGWAAVAAGGLLALAATSVSPWHRYWPAIVAAGLLVASLPWVTRPRCGGHFRGPVHSMWGLAAAIALALGPAAFGLWPGWAGVAVIAGWCSHLVLDAMTKEGIPLAWNLLTGDPGPRFAFLPRDASMTTGGKRRGRKWRRRSGPEYWLVQPALICIAVVAAFATLGSYR